jgi:hypothetical protein
MNLSLDFKAIGHGILVLLGGYIVWALVSSIIATIAKPSLPRWAWVVLLIMGLLVPVLAGVRSARLATANPFLNGAVAAFLGTVVILGALAAVVPMPIAPTATVAWLAAAGLFGWLGAILAPNIRPKSGL